MSPIFFLPKHLEFWTQSIRYETGGHYLILSLYTACIQLVCLANPSNLFSLNMEPSFSYNSTKDKKVDNYQWIKKEPCPCLINRFNSLKLATFWDAWFWNRKKRGQIFHNKTRTLDCKSFVEKVELKLPTMSRSFKTDLAFLCTLLQAYVYWKEKQCPVIVMNCIQLAWGKWTDYSTLYTKE